ncbi:serine/threonine-protein kinase [Arhodomonas sp. SL1]|uniref:serine/threonine-protein kinase n=1 Tax=Arhodomonas sp. SL1 TaxID=3425691 RepID=UPI003F880661
MSEPDASLSALQQALAVYARGEVEAQAVVIRLHAASRADGRPPEALIDALAADSGLTAAEQAALRAALLSDATALAARPSDSASTPTSGEVTRPVGDYEGPPLSQAPTRLPAEETVVEPSQGTGSDWSWSRPGQWREGNEEPLGPGRTLKQRFVLEALIGHGGMGSVYRARDLRREEAEDSDPYVAIKLLNDSFREHPDALVALQREAKKAQTLAHPNVVTVYDFDRDGTTVFLSMELMRGEPLDAVIRGRGAFGLPLAEALPIIEGMARGLAYAHEQGFAHADFKPGNVYVNQRGGVKVLDFGIARAARVAHSPPEENEHTRFDPASMGAITPAYASAEMLEGRAAEPADDVYALGCVAYELLTGRHPFRDAAGQKQPADVVAARNLQAQPIPKVPKRFNRAVLRALAPNREHRFADAGAFLKAIERPARLRRTALVTIVALVVVASASSWLFIRETNVMVSVSDLPPELAESRELIREGDDYAEAEEMAQAHKLYAQAWESGESLSGLPDRQLSRLRAVVERRINEVIDYYIARSREPELDRFSLELVQLTLESLARDDLGGREADIQEALVRVERRLAQASGRGDAGNEQ